MRAKKRGDSYRVQVFSHYEGNKRKYASFTAPTKALAEMKAAEFMASKKRRARHDLTIGDAVEGYISAKEAVLSPSTVRSYKQMVTYYAPLSKRKISTLTSEDIQKFISSLTVSPKTTRNIYSLLTSSIALYDPDISFRVTLPAKQIKRPVSPSDDDIRLLYDNASDKLKLCIYLGVKGLRRGEICALKYEDINNGVAHIHADMVKGTAGKWIYKEIIIHKITSLLLYHVSMFLSTEKGKNLFLFVIFLIFVLLLDSAAFLEYNFVNKVLALRTRAHKGHVSLQDVP